MKSRHQDQMALPPMEVQRLEKSGETGVQKVDVPEITLEMAKVQLGSAVRATLRRTDSSLKEFGDPSQVNRVCDGEVPTVLARVWARVDTRRALVIALADESGLFDIHTQISERRRA